MWRSFFNLRTLIASTLVVVFFLSAIYAYVDRPRLKVGSGGISDTISVQQDDFDGIVVRSNHYQEELEKRLTSPEFMKNLQANECRQPPIFRGNASPVVRRAAPPNLDTKPVENDLLRTVTDAYAGKKFAFLVGDSGQSDLYVMYLLPQCYQVERNDNRWICWLQSWLPGIPDADALSVEADAANLAVKDEITHQLQRAVKDSDSALRP